MCFVMSGKIVTVPVGIRLSGKRFFSLEFVVG